MIPCPHCGAQLNDTARFCIHCGKTLPASAAPASQASGPVSSGSLPAPSKRHCTHCGKAISLTAKFCPHCSTQLSPSRLLNPQQGSTAFPSMSAVPAVPAAPVPPVIGAPPTGKIPLGTIVSGRYVIQAVLGAGGMGAVYKALDNRLDTAVALKEMSDSQLHNPVDRQHAIEAFQNEALLLSKLNHVNLPRVTDFFSDGGNQFLVMDFIPGQTLAQMLDGRSQPFSEAQVLSWAEQLCDVLHYLHTRQPAVIFRDLKPGNVMVSPDGKNVKLIDFGIVRLFKPGAKKDTQSLGTPGYAPPEQYGKEQTDARSDIFALGALLHHLLTLRDPGVEMFKFPTVRSLNPKVSESVEEAILKAVKVNRLERWASAAEFKTALLPDASSTSQPIPAPPPAKPQPAPAPAPKAPPIAPPSVQPAPSPAPATVMETASIFARLGAVFVDAFILGLIIWVLVMIMDETGAYYGESVQLAWGVGIIGAYYTLLHALSGQTAGKKAARIKVVRTDGSRVGFVRALWRVAMWLGPAYGLYILFHEPWVPALILLVPVLNEERRTLHDYLSDTRVIKS